MQRLMQTDCFSRRSVLGAALCLLFAVTSVLAERLPVRVYTSADGLASGAVLEAIRDSRGFFLVPRRLYS